MKLNVFKIPNDKIKDFLLDLNNNEYKCEAIVDNEKSKCHLYLKKKRPETESWLNYYHNLLSDEKLLFYTKNIDSETVSGLFLIQKDHYSYVISYGQAHFIIRKHCDKDFGLNLAERILDPLGLKMKHSQTFTSAGKKDITSYIRNRKLDDSRDYGEAFSYVKCKTVNKNLWGETVDFGESVRFSFGKSFKLTPTDLYCFTDEIEKALQSQAKTRLPRYYKVVDKDILKSLNNELDKHFLDYITEVNVSDYWLTGVSFNFYNDYRYSLKFHHKNLTEICDKLDASYVREVIVNNKDIIESDYNDIKVLFYDENDEKLFSKKLKELLQLTVELNGKYYVSFQNEWVEFSESYVKFIEEQVDSIEYKLMPSTHQTETELIDSLVSSGKYIQLHKKNVYVGKYCIEKADLMDDDNIILIKDQHNQIDDLVYLIKQATTSLRLSNAGEVGENIFEGRNVCLWMLIQRKNLNKLSDFKSFHLLDALNDFKKSAINLNLTPEIWITLKK